MARRASWGRWSMLRRWSGAAAVLLLVGRGFADSPAGEGPSSAPALLPAAIETRVVPLDCGLRLIVVRDARWPLVSSQLWYRLGSANDPAARAGYCNIAHGRRARIGEGESRSEPVLWSHVQVFRDACCFLFAGPAASLGSQVRIQLDRVGAGTSTVAEFERERGRVAAAPAIKVSIEDADRAIVAAMFAGHSYARDPAAPLPAAGQYSHAEFVEFERKRFVPGAATLILYGDLEVERAIEVVRAHAQRIAWAEPPPISRREPPEPAGGRIVGSFASARAVISIAWPTPESASAENAPIDVLANYLCNPVDGMLMQLLKPRGVTAIAWTRGAARDAGILRIRLECAAWPMPAGGGLAHGLLRVHAIRSVVAATLKMVAAAPPELTILQRAKAITLGEFEARNSSFVNRALAFGAAECIGGDGLLTTFDRGLIESVSAVDLQIAAARLAEISAIVGVSSAGERDAADAAVGAVAPKDSGGLDLIRRQAAFSLGDSLPVLVAQIPSEIAVVRFDLAAAATAPNSARAGRAFRDDYLSFAGAHVECADDWGLPHLLTCPPERVAAVVELMVRSVAAARLAGVVVVTPEVPRAVADEIRAAVGPAPALSSDTVGGSAGHCRSSPPIAGPARGFGLPGDRCDVSESQFMDGPIDLCRTLSLKTASTQR